LSTALALGVGASGIAQLYRRMVFNVVAANRNDTTHKVIFLMDPTGQWRLAPAFDLTAASRPHGHQMTVNGRTTDITSPDLREVGRRFRVRDHVGMINAVTSTLAAWKDYAAYVQIPPDRSRDIGSTHPIGL